MTVEERLGQLLRQDATAYEPSAGGSDRIAARLERRRRARRAWRLAAVGAAVAVLIGVAVPLVTRGRGSGPEVVKVAPPSRGSAVGSPPGSSVPAAPAAAGEELVTVGGSSVRVLSAATGHVLSSRPLDPTLPQPPTGPIAVTPSGRTAYVGVLVGTACRSGEVVAVDLGSGRDRVVATAASGPAISPDGADLAWISVSRSCSQGQVTVEDLASGTRRSWQIASPATTGTQILTALAWALDDRRLVVASTLGPASGLQVLDTAEPVGSDNPAAIGPVSSRGGLPSGWYTYPAVRPDGTLIAILPRCVQATSCGGGPPPDEGDRVVTVDQPTGQLTSTVLPAAADPGMQLSGLVTDPAGQLVVEGQGPAGTNLYRITRGQLHLVAPNVAAAGWLPGVGSRKTHHPGSPGSSASRDGTLRGTLRMVGGPAPGISRPVPGTVRASAKGRHFTAAVGANGRFSIKLPPGSYEVTGHSPDVAGGVVTCIAGSPEQVEKGKTTLVQVACVIR